MVVPTVISVRKQALRWQNAYEPTEVVRATAESCNGVSFAKLPPKLFATEGKQGYQKSTEYEFSS